MSNQTKGLAALLAAHGRKGDTELMHVTKGEIAALNRIKRGMDGKDLPRNPKTGLHEANFFKQWAPQIGMALGTGAGILAAPYTGGMSLAAMGALGGAAGSGLGSVARGDDTQTALLNTAAGGVGGYGLGSMAAGLGAGAAGGAASGGTGVAGGGTGVVAPAGAAAPLPATATAPVADVALTSAPTSTANAFTGGSGAVGETLGTTNMINPYVESGIKLYEGGAGGAGLQMPSASGAGMKFGTGTTAAGTNTGGGLQTTPEIAKTMGTGGPQATNWNYLGTRDALGDATSVAMGAAAMTPGADSTSALGEDTGVDLSLPKTEVYYTPYGERRTRAVGRPQYGNVNMAGGGEVYGSYDGVEEGYANGGIASYGFGGFVESMQPGGWFGNLNAQAYGAVDKALPFMKDITPGGAMGQLQPGRRDWERKKREEEERKAREQQEGIAAAAAAADKAKEVADFNSMWSQRYGAPVRMASGGISDLGHYSDGGSLLRGPGDGVSDSIPASIEGKRPARLADGEFVVPARAVSELGNGSTEAGSKQLYAMLDRIAKKRKKGKGLAYESNPKKLMPV
jgi:hypothetical protein